MGYENDFVDEKPVELDVDGRIFKYKPTTGGDENEWLKDVMTLDLATRTPMVDWSIYNKKKLENVVVIPYDKILINKIISIEKEWPDLTTDERYLLLSKLKPGLFDKLINAIKKVDEPDLKSVKNSQG